MPDWSYQTLFRPILFELRPELARSLTLGAMGRLSRIPGGTFVIKTLGHMESHPILEQTAFGRIPFKYPVGLSGSLDPDGDAQRALAQFGFGFMEIGPVTVQGYEDERPILRDMPEEAILYPDMGGNAGLARIVERVKRGEGHSLARFFRIRPMPGSPPELALAELRELMAGLAPYAAGFYVDVLDRGWPLEESLALLTALSGGQGAARHAESAGENGAADGPEDVAGGAPNVRGASLGASIGDGTGGPADGAGEAANMRGVSRSPAVSGEDPMGGGAGEAQVGQGTARPANGAGEAASGGAARRSADGTYEARASQTAAQPAGKAAGHSRTMRREAVVGTSALDAAPALLLYLPLGLPPEQLGPLLADLGPGWDGLVTGEALHVQESAAPTVPQLDSAGSTSPTQPSSTAAGSEAGLSSPATGLSAAGALWRVGRDALPYSLNLLRHIRAESVPAARLPIIAAGGVHQPEDALRLMDAGADYVQLHSGLVYSGPGLPKRINEAVIYELVRTQEPPRVPSFWAHWGWMCLLGIGMICAGLGAWLVAATTVMLPYDVSFVGMDPEVLRAINPRLLEFMSHDRVTLAGTMMSIGILYYQLARHGLRAGLHWTRTALMVSGLVGFSSFFLYLGYGYLDPLHATAAAVLLPLFVLSMRGAVDLPSRAPVNLRNDTVWRRAQWGQLCFVIVGFALAAGGVIIAGVGISYVFVPTDLSFLCMTPEMLQAINERLIPLIAHDRAGFGGALFSNALAVLIIGLWGIGEGQRWVWWTLTAAGVPGFTAGFSVHFHIGYTDFIHLLPAYIAFILYVMGLILLYPYLVRRVQSRPAAADGREWSRNA